MRLTDLLLLPIVAMWQQKGRTALTTMGVVFGAFVLAASLSINHGVQETIVRESKRTDALRRINVHPDWSNRNNSTDDTEIVVDGKMSQDKQRRIRSALALQNRTQSATTMVMLSPETLQRLVSLKHVQRIEPRVEFQEIVQLNGQTHRVPIESAAPQDPAYLRRIVAGRFFEASNESTIVLSEFLLYRCGIVDDEAVEAVLGQKLKIEIQSRQNPEQEGLRVYLYRPDGRQTTPAEMKLLARLNRQIPALFKQLDLPALLAQVGLDAVEIEILRHAMESHAVETEVEAPISREFTIVGIMRQSTDQELNDRRWWDYLGGHSDVLLPYQTAADFFFSSASMSRGGLHQVSLVAEREEYVKEIAQEVKAMGLQVNAPIEFIERERLTWRLVFGGMTCIAAVALLVAAMGIANTLLMSVLERTREIGIMMSVGAAAIHIQTIFLIEGVLIGAAGGVMGVLLAWAASLPGDAYVRAMVERDMNVKLQDALFVFPFWLVVTVIAFAVLVTTGAAIYPARRAARIDPVTALRHE